MRVMVVDDERFVRAGVIHNINWASYGIDEVLEARDGMEGLRKLGSGRLDILITDIKMPKMDGISLALKGLAHNPDLKIIFISAYSDKEYLKSAITLNVVAYVEKPIALDELRDAIGKAVSSIEVAEKRSTESRMRETLRELMTSPPGRIHSAPLNKNHPQSRYCVGVIRYKNAQEPVLQNIGQTLVRLFEETGMRAWVFGDILKNDYVVVAESSSADDGGLKRVFQRHIDVVPDKAVFVSVSDTDSGLESIPGAFHLALGGMRMMFFKGYGTLFQPRRDQLDAGPFELDRELLDRFKGALVTRLHDQYEDAMRELLRRVEDGSVAEQGVRRAFYLLLELISNLSPEQDFAPGWNGVVECATVGELAQLVNSEAEKLLGQCRIKDRMVSAALGVITSEYGNQGLSIGYICDRLNIGKSKLCSAFRAETGMTINRYIAGYRIRMSQDMIAKGDIPFGEIARSVGFNGLNYFSKAFRRQTGMLPSVYKENLP